MASTLTWLLLTVSFIFSLHSESRSPPTSMVGNETDRLALLAFKDEIISDPRRILSSWNDSHHFCSWPGVTCGRRHQRVVVLYLPPSRLVGRISPHLANLSFLRVLDLGDNGFHGQLPPEFGRLFRLRGINMSDNFLEGQIPANIFRCVNLKSIILTNNKLVGRIPPNLGSMPKLKGLGLAGNYLTGLIPPSLGNLSSLMALSLSQNKLHGLIPDELGQLHQLQLLQLSLNNLSGTIPASLYNLSRIFVFDLTSNSLNGSLPQDIGLAFPNLQYLTVALNQFSGPIPVSLSNASMLEWLDLSDNRFTGLIPTDLGRSLTSLSILNLEINQLGTDQNVNDLLFINSLSNCSFLEVLSVKKNHLRGSLPDSIAKLSTRLQSFLLGVNMLHGTIPAGIGNLTQLRKLGMDKNLLTGPIPLGIEKFQSLEGLYLSGNYLSGQVPSSIGNLTSLVELDLSNNHLQGPLPSSIGNCSHLEQLDLSNNEFNGTIPKPLMGLSSLFLLNLINDSLEGPLPEEVGQLKSLTRLMISRNKLSGAIPNTLGLCASLIHLYMDGNFFEGAIPASLRALKGIINLDVSMNNLSGVIPKYFQNFSQLHYLNLSFNQFEGEVPKRGVFQNASAVSVLGNDKLCGGIPSLHLIPCPSIPEKSRSHNKRSLAIKIAVLVTTSFVALGVLVTCLFAICWRRKSRKNSPSTSSQIELEPYVRISYLELVNATNGFSSANLIGHGSFGAVYKGILSQHQTAIAVKVINIDHKRALKSFMAECNALRNIRHRNLVKILTACSSMDSKGNDFKALIFQYMPNGSLDKWLHPQIGQGELPRAFSIMERLNVAIDVASALDYLHNHCDPPIVHCDLKPSNVLLDEDMVAHVSDFGLAKMLVAGGKPSDLLTSTSCLKGSIGYIPPEYGSTGEVSKCGDVYSFGVILLEMFTGKCPTDDMFRDDISLPRLATMVFPGKVLEIADSQLLDESFENEDVRTSSKENLKERTQECLISVFRIGIACSAEAPQERMAIKDVCSEMIRAREAFCGDQLHQEKGYMDLHGENFEQSEESSRSSSARFRGKGTCGANYV